MTDSLALLRIPSPRSDSSDLADFAELLTLTVLDHNVSKDDVIRRLIQAQELIDEQEEIERDWIYEKAADIAFDELELRQEHMGRGHALYPFQLKGDLISFIGSLNGHSFLYLFLLLATRMNMAESRRVTVKGKGLDATAIFEELSLHVAKEYIGGEEEDITGGILFGTARSNSSQHPSLKVKPFKEAVELLCKSMGEGGGLRPKFKGPIFAKDDKLDVVVWRKFADGREGKLMIFGQCKTGTSWDGTLTSLSPSTFCARWMDRQPAVMPIKAHFLAERISIDNPGDFYYKSQDGGIIFDRCRILEFASSIPPILLGKCKSWSRAILRQHGINLS